MKKTKIGIVGAGDIAINRHIPVYKSLSDKVELISIFDKNRAVAEDIASKYNIPVVSNSFKEMLSQVDAVVICIPNKYHAEIAIEALNAGVHVQCEKPMAINPAECEMMIQASSDNNKLLAVAYHYRFTKEAEAAKKILNTGEIGKPLVIRVQGLRRRKVPGWGVFTNKDMQGGGSLIDYGCHLIDLTLWLLGNPKISEVSGATYQELSKSSPQVNEWGTFDSETFDVDDHCTAYIKFENGSTLLFETSWAANIKKDRQHISISGTLGGLNVYPTETYSTKNGMIIDTKSVWIPGYDDPGLPQALNFIDSINGEDILRVQPEEAMQTQLVIDAIYQSSRSGNAMIIPKEVIDYTH
jgi:predicted dehydrogenase